jgi:hypothetical protein
MIRAVERERDTPRLCEARGHTKCGLVEARGVEPLSEDRRLIASTCVADSLSFATTHAYRQA